MVFLLLGFKPDFTYTGVSIVGFEYSPLTKCKGKSERGGINNREG